MIIFLFFCSWSTGCTWVYHSRGLCTFAAAWGYRLIHIVACGTSDLIFVRKDVLEARPERGPVPTSRTFPTISYNPVGPIPSTPPPRLRLQASGVTFPAQDDAEGLCALATYQCQACCRLTCCHKVPQGQISISVWTTHVALRLSVSDSGPKRSQIRPDRGIRWN